MPARGKGGNKNGYNSSRRHRNCTFLREMCRRGPILITQRRCAMAGPSNQGSGFPEQQRRQESSGGGAVGSIKDKAQEAMSTAREKAQDFASTAAARAGD